MMAPKSLLTLLPTVLISVFVPILTIVYNTVTILLLNGKIMITNIAKIILFLLKPCVEFLDWLCSINHHFIHIFTICSFVQPHLGDIKTTIATYAGENRFYTKYLLKLKVKKNLKSIKVD